MKILSWLAAIIFLQSALAASSPEVLDDSHGLGISLTSGYGVISARLRDGKNVNIAKVEGGSRYKEYMRGMNNGSITELPSLYTPRSIWSKAYCRIWPESCPSGSILSPMIFALKYAAEATMEQSMDSAEFASSPTIRYYTYYPSAPYSAFKEHLEAAYRDANIRELLHYQPENGHYAACALEPHVNDANDGKFNVSNFYEADRIILTVENTRASLTLSLWEEDDGLYQSRREFHSVELGQSGLDHCIDTGNVSCIAPLETELRKIAQMPVKDESRTGNPYGYSDIVGHRIHSVIVFGEGAADNRLNAALETVLKEQYGSSKMQTMIRRSDFDPTFTAAAGLAQKNWGVRAYTHTEEYIRRYEGIKQGVDFAW